MTVAGSKKKNCATKNSHWMKIFSMGIVAFIFAIILTTAVSVVRYSIVSDTSNIKIISHFMSEHTANALGSQGSGYASLPKTLCAKPLNIQNASLVQFLNAQGVDSSFDSRASLAHIIGIENYAGTYEQNTLILQHLISAYSKLLSNCS